LQDSWSKTILSLNSSQRSQRKLASKLNESPQSATLLSSFASLIFNGYYCFFVGHKFSPHLSGSLSLFFACFLLSWLAGAIAMVVAILVPRWCNGLPVRATRSRSLGRSRTVRPASSVRLYSFNSLVLCARRRRWRHLASAAPRKSMNPPSRLQRASCSCSCSFTSNLRLLQPRPVRPRAKQHGGGSQTIANKLGNQNLLSAHFASLPSRRPPRRLQGSLARPPARSIRLVPLSLSLGRQNHGPSAGGHSKAAQRERGAQAELRSPKGWMDGGQSGEV